MRISKVSLSNTMNHRSYNLSIPASAQLTIIAGPNGSGKTTIAQSIRLALTGEPVRGLVYKNELSALITQGEKDGKVDVITEDPAAPVGSPAVWKYSVSLKSGARTAKVIDGSDAATNVPTYAFDPSELLTIDIKARQKEIFKLSGIKMNLDSVMVELTDKGHAPERIERACKYLRLVGFDAAAKEAREAATEARGAWKAITGETYGEVKAESWKASIPKRQVEGKLSDLKAAFEKSVTSLETAKAAQDNLVAAEAATRSALKLVAARDDLKANEARLIKATKAAENAAHKLNETEKAASYKGGETCPCPSCGVVLFWNAKGALAEWDKSVQSSGNPIEAFGKLDEVRAEKRKADAEHAAVVALIAEGKAATVALESMPERPSDDALADARNAVLAAQAAHTLAKSDYDVAQKERDAEGHAQAQTEVAKGHHLDVGGYVALADAIEQIPGTYLSKAIGKINELLAEAAASFGTPVVVGQDMSPMYGTIPYALASESQQWRIRMAFGYAISVMSGLGILVLDGFDVIQPSARGPIIKFLATQDKVQAILLATLKEAPKMPPSVAVEWLG